MKKYTFFFIAILVIGGSLYGGGLELLKAGKAGTDRELTRGAVARGQIRTTLSFLGEITPEIQVKLRSEVSGRIEEVNGESGAPVTQGDLLIRLDERILLNEKRRLEIDISTAKYQTAIAERKYEELKGLSGEFASRNEVLNKEAEHKIALNDIKRLEMKLEEVQEKLKKVRITSPITGTILELNVKPGEVVAGAESASGGSVIMQIADLENLIVTGNVNQADIGSVRTGLKGQASSLLNPKVRVPCEIVAIDPVAKKDENGSRSFAVTLRLLKNHPELRPGMTTRIKFPLRQVEDALVVPVQAVFGVPPQTFVYKVTGPGAYERVMVTRGLVGTNKAEILEGVEEGDTILLEDPHLDNPPVERGRLNTRGGSTPTKKKVKSKS